MKTKALILSILVFAAFLARAEDKKNLQEVHFDGSSVDGQARLPNGSSIVEARLKEILPLFELDKEFRDKVYESIDQMK